MTTKAVQSKKVEIFNGPLIRREHWCSSKKQNRERLV